MKILQVNQFYYPRGGADIYFLNLTRELREAGHQVAVFSMDHPKNLESPWSKYFVSRVSFNEAGLWDKLKTPGRVLYSWESKNKFSRLLDDFRPDIIHIHNIYHHISPSILDAAKDRHIPVVMHLHDYKLVCANHALFTKGAFCERCRPNKYYECLLNRCIKDSWAGSALAVAEMYLHHSWLKIYERDVDVFIAPSNFMKDTLVRFGREADKIKVIYNPFDREIASMTPQETNNRKGSYLLYFGRLSREKGLETLIKAASLTGKSVKIAGVGPEAGNLEILAKDLQAPIEFLGFKNSKELKSLISGAEAVIIPSIWGENMPLSLLEAMSLGQIVIASRIGGLPELIEDGYSGLLFEPGNQDDLAAQIRRLADLDRESISLQARQAVKSLSPSLNLEKVLAVYQELLQ